MEDVPCVRALTFEERNFKRWSTKIRQAKWPHLIFCHNLLGRWALSMVFIYRYKRPFSSRMVAYLLFANGQDDLLHSPVTLYSFLQKFCVFVFTLYVQCP